MITGMEPSISITAKSVKDTVTICEKSVLLSPNCFILTKIVTFELQF
jgi:hypothetical protein